MASLTLFFLLQLPGAAQPVTLEHLLEVERGCWGPAWVSSGFHDWRSVSRYRSRAGLHLGYDIAMPYGSPVAAAWPGRVVAVTPWTSTEFGVTVRSDQGWEVTYGHISPGVRPGQWVASGTVIGLIASDHVDVKMRDTDGSYVAFAEGPPKGAARTAACVQADFLQWYEKGEKLRAELSLARAALERSREGAGLRLEQGRTLAQRGLLSERELRELESAAALERREAPSPQQVTQLQGELERVEVALESLRTEARRLRALLPSSIGGDSQRLQQPKVDFERERLWSLGLISTRERGQVEVSRSRIGNSPPRQGDNHAAPVGSQPPGRHL